MFTAVAAQKYLYDVEGDEDDETKVDDFEEEVNVLTETENGYINSEVRDQHYDETRIK